MNKVNDSEREMARAAVDAGYMPLPEYIERYQTEASGPSEPLHSATSTAVHTPGPWRIGPLTADRRYIYGNKAEIAGDYCVASVLDGNGMTCNLANARLIAAAPDLLAALKAACGYMTNAAIDLETGAPKKTALATINGGLALVRTAIARAEAQS